MKNLPIGISTLRTIINNNMVYIDKTAAAYSLVKTPGRYFLSRPRRFGKSLFIDTLKEIFEGSEELFRGLFIHAPWDWKKKYPVIKIDFTAGVIKSTGDLRVRVLDIFRRNADRLGLSLRTDTDIPGILGDIIGQAAAQYGMPAVLLVDEYDKPLLDNIENPAMAKEIRDELKNLYSVIKDRDGDLQFVFLTGVSKFSKVNIFSGINNLSDITLDEKYAVICGYTQQDLETSFAEHLRDVDWNKLKEWYNGYNFLGETVYNPFDILLFIDKGKSYRNYWFETGTPTFLVELMKRERYFLPDLDTIEVGEEILSSFDIEQMESTTLLFQTGYLTIQKQIQKHEEIRYRLCYPNQEVKRSLNRYLIEGYAQIGETKTRYQDSVYDALEKGDLPGLEAAVTRLFAGIPYRNFTNTGLSKFEGYYASVLYAFFASVNCTVIPEDVSNRGQADMTVILKDNIYVMEIKVVPESGGSGNPALEQIQEKNYARKYIGRPGFRVFEVGMVFTENERNLTAFDWTEP